MYNTDFLSHIEASRERIFGGVPSWERFGYGERAGVPAPTTQVLSDDARTLLRHLTMFGQSPVAVLRHRDLVRDLEQAGLVESDAVGSDALVSITVAGRAALGGTPMDDPRLTTGVAEGTMVASLARTDDSLPADSGYNSSASHLAAHQTGASLLAKDEVTRERWAAFILGG